MKLIFASIATGIVVVVGLFITLLFVRALFRDNASTMLVTWLFVWPVWLVRRWPGISSTAAVWLSLAIGMLLDILLVSVVAYFVLRAIISKHKRSTSSANALRPQAPTF